MPEQLVGGQHGRLQRVPPHDLELEAHLLGAALLTAEAARVFIGATPDEDFYGPGNAHVAAVIRELVMEGATVDVGTVAAILRQRGLLDQAGGPKKLVSHTVGCPATQAAPKWLELLQSLARKRKTLALVNEVVEAVYRGVTVEGLVAELGAVSWADETARETTWDPVNLVAVLAGEGTVPEPAALRREDGVALLYPGKVHALNAEPEAGKSWLCQAACAQEITAHRHVVYIDFEGDAVDVVCRLLELGCEPTEVVEYFHYVRPEDPIDAHARLRVVALADVFRPSLAVIDGVTEAMANSGWRTNDNDDVARFYAGLPRPLARAGAAVVVIDHVTKDRENRGRWAIGGQHKMAGIDGATFSLEAVKPFSRGCSGQSRLVVQKDRHGRIRPHAAAQKVLAEVHFVSRAAGAMTVAIRPPADRSDTAFRPTGYMERVSRALEDWPDVPAATSRQLRTVVPGKGTVIDAAIQALAREGYIALATGPKNTIVHRSLRPFREAEEARDDDLDPVENNEEEPF